jgi:DNA-binding beta-propeller fold protein YncE
MKAIRLAVPRIAVAALSCAALLQSSAALASAGPAPAAAAAGRAVTVYVANQISNTVTPISAATNKPGRPIPLPPDSFPTFMAIAPSGKTLYVLSSTANPELG